MPPAPPISAAHGFRHRPLWVLAAVGMLAAQVGLALQLFGGWGGVLDDRPVTSGCHPLHQYHAGVGAGSLREHARSSAFDPAFQAGYPKTPVFSSAARVAEPVVWALNRPEGHPAGYKLALLLLCAAVPVAFVAAGRGFGIPASGTVWAGVGGCFVWWSVPVRAVLDAGHLDLLAVGLAFVLFLGGFARYSARPGVSAWLKTAAASVVGWYVHPIAWCGLFPAVAVFYLMAAPRHGLAWHLGAIAVPVLGLGVNLWWLADWAAFWWVQCEPTNGRLPDWRAVGDVGELLRVLSGGGWVGVALAAAGLGCIIRRERRGAAGGVLASVAVALFTARVGEVCGTDAKLAAAGVPALLALPGAFAIAKLFHPMKIGPVLKVLAVSGLLAAGWHPPAMEWAADMLPAVTPLPMGLTEPQQLLADLLREKTKPDARILLEETGDTGVNWTPLLPPLTGRCFIGGLDAGRSLEHSAIELRTGQLAGRPFSEWTPDRRADYCRRYNVGWVLCRTPETTEWWACDPTATEVGRADGAVLFELKRKRSFALSGTATVERMDRGRIVLRDVSPDETGCVKLSLHFQKELRCSPHPLVTTSAEKDPHDPIPFLTLKVPAGVSRVTLAWERR